MEWGTVISIIGILLNLWDRGRIWLEACNNYLLEILITISYEKGKGFTTCLVPLLFDKEYNIQE